jgi:histidinol-phosphate aminotransferase
VYIGVYQWFPISLQRLGKMAIRESIHALHAYVPGEQPTSPDVLKLNTNENPYPPSAKVLEALAGIMADALRKYPDPSGRELREALADAHGLTPEHFIVVNGSDEGLALCTRCFCEHGGTVGYLQPSYSLYPVLTEIAEHRKLEFPLNEDFSWTVPEQVEVDLFFLTRPNAPTSLSLPKQEVEILLERCPGVVVVDEAYAAFAEDHFMGRVGEVPNLLVSRTFSKSHSLAGVRVGYLAGPVKLIEALHKIRDSYNLDALAQRLAAASVQDKKYTQETVGKIKATRERISSQLTGLGFQVLDSQTNFLFAQVPHNQDAQHLFDALKEKQIYVRYFPGDMTGTYLRITIGTDEQMNRFINELRILIS